MISDIKLGYVVSVDISNNKINVSTEMGSTGVPVDLDSPISMQEMPTVGSMVLWVEFGSVSLIKIIKIWQNRVDLLRSGAGPLLPGEVQCGSSGGGYIYFNKSGDVSIVDGSMRNIFQMLKLKMQSILKSTNIVLKTFSGNSINMSSDGSCSVKTTDSEGNETASVSIDRSGNINIFTQQITLQTEVDPDSGAINTVLDLVDVDVIRLGGRAKLVTCSGDQDGKITSLTQLRASGKITGG